MDLPDLFEETAAALTLTDYLENSWHPQVFAIHYYLLVILVLWCRGEKKKISVRSDLATSSTFC